MMNQNLTPICESCGCEEPRLYHYIWYGDLGREKLQRLCTSCVLFTCKIYYCPTCFGFHGLDSEAELATCERCNSRSHPVCFSTNSTYLMCASCVDPKRLIFNPKELKLEGVDGNCKRVDLNASTLFLTAAKISCSLMCRAWEDFKYQAVIKALETVMEYDKGNLGVKHVMKDHDLKNNDRNVDSLLDFSDSDDDSSCETLSDSGRMQRLRTEGEVVAREIDLNEDDAI